MTMKKEKAPNMTRQWAKFVVVLALYLLFLYWVKSWMGLLAVPFIFDAYITKKIKWQWWKNAEHPVKFLMSWVDALVFALVAVYFINLFFFQNYVIPSSSLEKSLLTGDYLFVSKVSYGPRIPQTPLTMPLTQHTLPVLNMKSYIDWPHWDYRRVKGLGKVELNDIVVFNYPAGDTILAEVPYQTEYYKMVYDSGEQISVQNVGMPDFSSLTQQQVHEIYEDVYAMGRNYLKNNASEFGDIKSRPTDRRENYVKRCVGLPGQTLEIKNRIVYLDGKPNKEPDNVQYTYKVRLHQQIPHELMRELGISSEQVVQLSRYGYMALTDHAAKALKRRTDIVESLVLNTEVDADDRVYPRNAAYGWTRDNYGPVWIPKKGESIALTMDNIAIYERAIKVYEDNRLEVNDGKIYINGQPATSYTFKMDYYWMQGDNRHNSADSRYWGFVPEDHIVGKPIFIWWSSDPDQGGVSGIRWSRLFRFVDNIK